MVCTIFNKRTQINTGGANNKMSCINCTKGEIHLFHNIIVNTVEGDC